MFFKKRYFRLSRFSNRFLYLFNLFFNFNNFFFEFLGNLGFFKIYLNLFSFDKSGKFLKIFSLFCKNFKISNGVYSLILNIVRGLIFEYNKRIILFGLGYKVSLRCKNLFFYLSYSHPIVYNIPNDVNIEVKSNEIMVKGLSKQRVGEICLFIRNFKKPDPYKGKGVRYLNEKIKLKLIKKK